MLDILYRLKPNLFPYFLKIHILALFLKKIICIKVAFLWICGERFVILWQKSIRKQF